MSVESYFINSIFDDVEYASIGGLNSFKGTSELCFDKISEFFLNEGLVKKDDNNYILDDSIIIRLINKDEKILALSMEGCFSWYPNGVKTMVALTEKINLHCHKAKFFHPAVGIFNISQKEEFIKEIEKEYLNKFTLFKSNYAVTNKKLLPGKEFFKYVKKKNRFYNKLFKIFQN